MSRRSDRRPPNRTPLRQHRETARSSHSESRLIGIQKQNERQQRICSQFESAQVNAEEWIARIGSPRALEDLLEPPLPDRFTLSAMAGRARSLTVSRPDLAERVARALLVFADAVPKTSRFPDELPVSASLVLATCRRLCGDLEAAETLLQGARAQISGAGQDPLFAAELAVEEAEISAARGRFREAIESARTALAAYSDPNLYPHLRLDLLRKVAVWAAAAEARRQ